VRGHARFTAPDEIEVGGERLTARRFVIATGSRAMVPPIPGLDGVPFMTNETVFDNTRRPDHLIVIGGRPIGCELAQAHRQLGSKVTVIEMFSILPKDDPELVEVVRRHLLADGVTLLEGTKVKSVAGRDGAVSVTVERNGADERVDGSHILVAAGRQPNVDDMDLDKAGVTYERKGIGVDSRLRTSNPKIYAIGDCAGGFQFTHVANYHAGIVIRNALLRLPTKVNYAALPWVTYTAPELAHVGMSEAEARQRHGEDVRILKFPYAENDRAVAERQTAGMVKVMVTRRGKILGASIVGARAGDIIHPWVLAIGGGLKIGAMAQMIAPYPTFAEINKRAAGSFYTPSVFGPKMKAVVRFLSHFG
jgi:pyruvate/2-oxoglutarate dehydrogenase complex dihydrolipoamide dehydrogenase (E3) component